MWALGLVPLVLSLRDSPTLEPLQETAVDAKAVPEKAYAPLDFTEASARLEALAKARPDLVELTTAEDEFNIPADTCGDTKCPIYILKIGKEADPQKSRQTPEVFISGALHGDEMVGPTMSVELAQFLVDNYDTDESIKYLVDTRNVYIMPFANCIGFCQKTRDENGIDPNRDFPYDRSTAAPADETGAELEEGKCLQTKAARAINSLFREHQFLLSLSVHAGNRSLLYPWGSYEHLEQADTKVSTHAPDLSAYRAVGYELMKAGGLDPEGSEWYSKWGPTSQNQYPKRGEFEDWAYGASWEGAALITKCRGLPADEKYKYNSIYESSYDPNNVRAMSFMIQTDHNKAPAPEEYGTPAGVLDSTKGEGQISRNIRLALKLMEFAEPTLRLKILPAKDTSSILIQTMGIGCSTVEAQIAVVPQSCDIPISDDTFRGSVRLPRPECSGLPLHGKEEWTTVQLMVPDGEEWCVHARANFDEDWADGATSQAHGADPNLPPQSFLTRQRTVQNYKAFHGEHEVVGNRDWDFKAECGEICKERGQVVANQVENLPTEEPMVLPEKDTMNMTEIDTLEAGKSNATLSLTDPNEDFNVTELEKDEAERFAEHDAKLNSTVEQDAVVAEGKAVEAKFKQLEAESAVKRAAKDAANEAVKKEKALEELDEEEQQKHAQTEARAQQEHEKQAAKLQAQQATQEAEAAAENTKTTAAAENTETTAAAGNTEATAESKEAAAENAEAVAKNSEAAAENTEATDEKKEETEATSEMQTTQVSVNGAGALMQMLQLRRVPK